MAIFSIYAIFLELSNEWTDKTGRGVRAGGARTPLRTSKEKDIAASAKKMKKLQSHEKDEASISRHSPFFQCTVRNFGKKEEEFLGVFLAILDFDMIIPQTTE